MAPAPSTHHPAPIKKDKKTRFLETVAICSFYTPGHPRPPK